MPGRSQSQRTSLARLSQILGSGGCLSSSKKIIMAITIIKPKTIQTRLSDPGRRGCFPSLVPHIPAMQVNFFSFPARYGRSLQRGEPGTLPDSMRPDLIQYHGKQGVNPRKPKWNPCCTTSLEGGCIASVWRILIASRSRSEKKKTDFCLILSRHLGLSHGMGKL
jgi:hypothetical protein